MRQKPAEHLDTPVTIYLLRNRVNGKCYVGLTEDFDERMRQHSKVDSGCPALGNAVRKHGWEAFDASVLELATRSAGGNTERRWIAALDCQAPHGYNLTDGGTMGKPAQEARQKISEFQKALWARGESPWQTETPEQRKAWRAKQSATMTAKGARGELAVQYESPDKKAARRTQQSVTRIRKNATRRYEARTDAGQTYALALPLVEVDRSHKRHPTTRSRQSRRRLKDVADNRETQLTLGRVTTDNGEPL